MNFVALPRIQSSQMVNFVGATSLNLTGKLEKHRVADALPLSNPRASLEARVRHHGCVSSHHRPLHARVVRWRRAFAAVDSAREPCRCPRLGFFFRVWTGTRKRAGTAVSEGRDTGNPRQTPLRSSARVSRVFPVSPCSAGGGDVPSAPRFRGIRPRSGNIGFSQRGESGRPSARAIRRARRSWPRVRLRLIAPDYLRSSPRATSRPPRHRHPPSVALTFAAPPLHISVFVARRFRSQGARAPQEEQG